MIINDAALRSVFTGYKTKFQSGWSRADPFFEKVAMVTSSGTGEETYTWLGQFPQMREWIGDRVINNLAARGYTIVNRKFEQTIAVPRTKMEDDQFGVYGPLFDEMGKDSAEQPDRLVAELLSDGFTANCYDGQPFFDADHPVLDAAGQEYSKSNFDAGSGPAWYLIDGSRAVGGVIYQKRVDYNFQALDQDRDGHVFFRDEFIYGVRGRSNAGYGFWQLMHASKADLTADTYAAARKAMTTMRGDFDRPLGIKPTILLVPSGLEEEGRRIINSQLGSGGESNPWVGSAELIVTPWLAS